MNATKNVRAKASREPIAIVGIGCTLPGGVDGPESYWNLLCSGASGIVPVPEDRWSIEAHYDPDPKITGKSITKWGGFVPGIADFDANFFGISPREADAMDPQQRMALQVTWEALEDAGIAADRLAGSNTAVYIGVSLNDYSLIQRFRRSAEDLHAGTGTAVSIIAARISHRLDLRGPSMVVDTACSSSMVATDLACQTLWSGQSDLAFAGGVNAMFDPGLFINFSKANMMSPTGRCHTFDASADGYVRGEGAGVVVLKPLSAAQADGDRIYAVIRATAVNQDGRTGTITVPSKDAQTAMLMEVCLRAGVDPDEIGYVEAHGTGTPIGDPIETAAIGEVFGVNRSNGSRVVVGASKTNLGHLESGAGVAGLIKTALCIHNRAIPPSLNFETPNPNIDLDALNLTLAREHKPWGSNGEILKAVVNSFGFGGTNSCAVLEQPPRLKPTTRPVKRSVEEDARHWLVPLSAATPVALSETAAILSRELSEAGEAAAALRDIAGTAALRRSHLSHRLALVATSTKDLATKLNAFVTGEPLADLPEGAPKPIITGRSDGEQPLVFAFTGQGSQWLGMGRGLLQHDPVFRETIETFDEIFCDIAGWSVVEELLAAEADSRIDETAITQPAIFAVQIGLAARWRAWGIEPDAVLGHSLGEIAAAHVCGVLSLEDAARVIYHRGRLQADTEGKGGIAAIGLPRPEAQALLDEMADGQVEIAGVNGSAMVNFAGDRKVLETIIEHLEARDDKPFVRLLRMNYAPHSPQMEWIKEPLLESLAEITPGRPKIPMISTVTGTVIEGEIDADYWWRNVRDPVLFQPAIAEAIKLGYSAFLEVGPHAVLSGLIMACLAEGGKTGLVVPSLTRKQPDLDSIYASLGTLYVHGFSMAWESIAEPRYNFVRLPRYPWEKQRFWAGSEEAQEVLFEAPVHPLLGRRLHAARPTWASEIDLKSFSYLLDHRIDGAVVFPATGYLEIILAAARQIFGEGTLEVEDITFHEALFLSENESELVQTLFEPERSTVRIYSRTRDGNPDWALRASAHIRQHPMPVPEAQWPEQSGEASLDGEEAKAETGIAREPFYRRAAKRSYEYGPAFQGIERLWPEGDSVRALISVAPEIAEKTADYIFHPGPFDACLQLPLGLVGEIEEGDQAEQSTLYLPTGIRRLRFFDAPQNRLWATARLVAREGRSVTSEMVVANQEGGVVATLEGFSARAINSRSAKKGGDKASLAHYQEYWEEAVLEPSEGDAPEPGTWLILADETALNEGLVSGLESAGHRCIQVRKGEAFGSDSEDRFEIRLGEPEDIAKLIDEAAKITPALSGIVHCWSLEAARLNGSFNAETLMAAQDATCLTLLHLAQALGTLENLEPRIWLITQGARALDLDDPLASQHPALTQAPLVGLARTVIAELPDLSCSVIDLDPDQDDQDSVKALLAEFEVDSSETEVTFRGDNRYVNRLARVAADEITPKMVAAEGAEGFRLTMTSPGVIDSLRVVEADRLDPGPGQVRLEVRAAGLNFRDVMAATGLLPDEAEEGDSWDNLGLECCGVVNAVGEGVTSVSPGDHVMSAISGAFRSEVVVPAEVAYPMPKGMGFVDGATIPTAFFTAYYALETLGRLSKGERILIHVATGGVGLAAIQIARRAGAEIFATAGSEEKRDYLRALGIEHVMDSRSLDFADQIMAATHDQGIDMILNSLPDAFIDRGISILAPCGRFLEIGKRDVYADKPMGLRALRNNITFYAIDLARLANDRPDKMIATFKELKRLFETGELAPLPTTEFPLSQADEAFRYMAKALHIGKVVISMDDPKLRVALSPDRTMTLGAEASYLITGGLSGFGLAVARWMAERGAGHLFLMSRSGAATDEAKDAIEEMQAAGTQVSVIAGDVTKAADVNAAIERIAASSQPLRGVIHGAMVLDDGLLSQLDRERFERVLAPKMLGAWHLHEATAGLPLDFFVMFSSVAALLGSTGQGNYVAGNAFLDAFARYRHGLGLPALTINWGALGGAGFVERNDAMARYLDSMGIPPVALPESLEGLGRLLRQDATVIALARLDWQKLARTNPSIGDSLRMAHLTASNEEGAGRIRGAILAAPAANRPAIVIKYLAGQVARVLKVDPGKIEADRPLSDLGLDSLTSFELKNRIEADLNTNLPVNKFLQSPTLSGLAGVILELLESDADTTEEIEAGSELEGGESSLTMRQEKVWWMYQSHPERVSAHREFELKWCVSVKPGMDLARLQKSFDEVVARHPALRMSLPSRDGQPVMHIAEDHPNGVESHDVRDLNEKEFAALLETRADEAFDIENGPLFRVQVFHRPENHDFVLIKIHHLVTDGWSNSLYMGQLFGGYYGLTGIQDVSQGTETFEYTDFVRWQRRWIDSPEGLEQLAFWREQLRDLGPAIELPYEGERKGGLTQRSAHHRFIIDDETSRLVIKLAAEAKTTPYAVLLASFQLLIFAYSGRHDLPINVTAAGRTRPEFESLGGWINNRLVVRNRLQDAISFEKHLDAVTATLREAIANQDYPIELVQKALEEDVGEVPPALGQLGCYMLRPDNLEDAGFGTLLQNVERVTIKFGEIEITSVPIGQSGTGRDLTLYVQEQDGRIFSYFLYNADLFSATTMEQMAGDYMDMLRSIVADPAAPLARIAHFENRAVAE